MTDLNRRYAVSLYVDLRLGLIGNRIYNPQEAQAETAKVYGSECASYAREVAN